MQLGRFSVIVLLGLSTGCSFSPLVRRAAVEYNRTLEDVQNSMLLLNVIRGSKRVPFHYSALNKLTGNVKGSVGLSGEFPTSGASKFTPGLTLEGGTASFDVAPLDTQEFYRGVMKPIEPKLFTYYWQQGWPHDLLLYALVDHIDVVSRLNHRTRTYTNYPGDHCKFREYSALVRCLVHARMGITVHPYSEPIVSGHSCDGKIIVAGLKKDDLEVKADPCHKDRCILAKPKKSYGLCFDRACVDAGEKTPKKKSTDKGKSCDGDDVRPADHATNTLPIEASVGAAEACASDIESIELTLRSPEAVLYYLGQLQRETEPLDREDVCIQRDATSCFLHATRNPEQCTAGDKFTPPMIETRIDDKPTCIPMLSIQRGGGRGKIPTSRLDRGALEVRYDNAYYRIPTSDGTCRNQSLHALSLIGQLIGLQKSAKDLPSQETITVLPVQ